MKNVLSYIFLIPIGIFLHLLLFLFAFVVILLDKFLKRTNCWAWALNKWLKEGGFILIRKSYWGPYLHLQHVDKEGIIREYTPFEQKKPHIVPPPIFKGYVKITGRLNKDNEC